MGRKEESIKHLLTLFPILQAFLSFLHSDPSLTKVIMTKDKFPLRQIWIFMPWWIKNSWKLSSVYPSIPLEDIANTIFSLQLPRYSRVAARTEKKYGLRWNGKGMYYTVIHESIAANAVIMNLLLFMLL